MDGRTLVNYCPDELFRPGPCRPLRTGVVLDKRLEKAKLADPKGGAVSGFEAEDLKLMRRNATDAAALLRAISHEARLLVLCELNNGERSAGELVERSGLSQSALSQHLAKLREEGLVATRREAQVIHYCIADQRAQRLLRVLHDIYCRK